MDDPRVWARGKSALELLTLTDQTVTALHNIATMPTQQPQVPQQQGFQLPEDDEIIDGRRLKEIMSRVQAPQQDMYSTDAMAQIALATVKRDHKETFDRYGHEVMGNLAQLDKRMWTLDNIARIVRMVRADHVDEIAAEKAQALATQTGFAARASGTAGGYPGTNGSAPSLESEELPADYRERLKKAGITEATAREFCRVSGIKFTDWLKSAKGVKSAIGEE